MYLCLLGRRRLLVAGVFPELKLWPGAAAKASK